MYWLVTLIYLIWGHVATDSELDRVIARHMSGRARLISLRAEWDVEFLDENGRVAGEEVGWTQIVGGSEAGSFAGPSGQQAYVWRNGELRWMVGYQSDDFEADPASVEAVRAQLYNSDLPIKRTFQGRTLLAFKLIASEPNSDLDRFCQLSVSPPTLRRDGSLYEIGVTHPGVLQPSGIRAHRESIVRIWLDPEKQFAAVRQRTVLREKSDAPEIVLDTRVKRFEEMHNNVWLPIELETTIGSQRQVMRVRYTSVNQGSQIDEKIFPAGTLVRQYEHYGDEDADVFYVVDDTGELGEPILDEVQASKLRYGILSEKIAQQKIPSVFNWLVIAAFGIVVLAAAVMWRKRYLN